MGKSVYNDEWLINNISYYRSYKELTEAYNKIFKVNKSIHAMQMHCGDYLGLRMKRTGSEFFTTEQKKWIVENYSDYGNEELSIRFNSQFPGEHRDRISMRNFARRNGLTVNQDVVTELKRRPHNNGYSKRSIKPVGFIREEKRGSDSLLLVKSENGKWVSAGKYILEKNGILVSNDEQILYLDGDKTNLSPDNMIPIPKKYAAVISANKMWTIHPTLSKTVVRWCDLYFALKNSEKILTKE